MILIYKNIYYIKKTEDAQGTAALDLGTQMDKHSLAHPVFSVAVQIVRD